MTALLRNKQTTTEIGLAGMAALLDLSGGMYLPDDDTLLVADLHFEKGSSFARRGMLLPPYDTRETLTAGCKPAGVAMRQRASARAEELCRVRRHRAAPFDLVGVQHPGPLDCRLLAHLLERPAQVDSGRTRSRQRRRRRVDVLPTLGRERQPVRRCDADRRRAANRKLADRHHELIDRAALQLDLLVRQPTLVEEDDLRALLLVPNDVVGV